MPALSIGYLRLNSSHGAFSYADSTGKYKKPAIHIFLVHLKTEKRDKFVSLGAQIKKAHYMPVPVNANELET